MRFFASSLIAAASLFAAASASAQTPPAAPVAPAAPAPAAPAPAAPAAQAAQASAPLAPYAAPYPYVVPYYLPPMERRSKALMTTGIIAWVGGAVATVAGSVVFIQGVGSVCVETADGGAPAGGFRRAHRARGERIGSARQAFDSCGGHPDLGFAILTAGQLVSLGGVPLFVLGNMKVPVRHPSDEGSLAPAVNVGLGGVDLSWKF